VYKCQNCGAPLEGVLCPYCGARNEIDLKARYEIHKESERVCPNCDVFLDTITLSEEDALYIEQCRHCFGIFLDYGEIEAIMEREIVRSEKRDFKRLREILERPLAREKEVRYKKCPQCRKVMSRINYRRRSGVIIDRCIECGYWFDGGELRQIMEWAKLSGTREFTPVIREEEMTFATPKSAKKGLSRFERGEDAAGFLVEGLMRWLYGL